MAENRQDWDKRRQEAQHSKLTQAEKRQKQKKLRGDMASQKHCPTPTQCDLAAVLHTAEPTELQEHPSKLSLAENRQDWEKRRQEAQLSKLTQAEKRQDQKKLRQNPWRLNLYSVATSTRWQSLAISASEEHCPTLTHHDLAAVLHT